MVLGRITGPLLFLVSRRHKIYKLRKKYDRVREKANKIRDYEKRNSIFSILDQVEPNLVILEEQNLSRLERGRTLKFVGSGIRKSEQILKSHEERKEVRKIG
ncbi:MAG: hypothetical protein HYT73_00025 [Candidatus Aenigmarchaeota archaeon]|nr:hypothetical protein [Candidatus Aenigmarchaeota archaeon]